MKPVLNTVPKSPLFVCERKINKECTRPYCDAGAGTPHAHDNDRESVFNCSYLQADVWCRMI